MKALPITQQSPWLAPLAGYSDLAFRLLCREYGAKVTCTEMVSSKGLMYNSNGTRDLLQTVAADNPLVVQLFGSDVESLEKSLAYLLEQGFSYFDLNMGCSVRKVNRSGCGSAMLKDLEHCLKIAKVMIDIAGPNCMGFKMRLGWDDDSHIWQELPLRLQDLGAAWITLHPRTARQGFSGNAHWPSLADLEKKLDIPLMASGDLFSAEDGVNCLLQTKVQGLMYARGAMQNPAVFNEHIALWEKASQAGLTSANELPAHVKLSFDEKLSPHGLLQMIRRHMELAQLYSPPRVGLLKMRTFVPRYVHHFPGVRALRQALAACQSWEQLDEILQEFLAIQDRNI